MYYICLHYLLYAIALYHNQIQGTYNRQIKWANYETRVIYMKCVIYNKASICIY